MLPNTSTNSNSTSFDIFGGRGYPNLSDLEFSNYDDLCFSASGGGFEHRYGERQYEPRYVERQYEPRYGKRPHEPLYEESYLEFSGRGASVKKDYARLKNSNNPWLKHVYKSITENPDKYLNKNGLIDFKACKAGYKRTNGGQPSVSKRKRKKK